MYMCGVKGYVGLKGRHVGTLFYPYHGSLYSLAPPIASLYRVEVIPVSVVTTPAGAQVSYVS